MDVCDVAAAVVDISDVISVVVADFQSLKSSLILNCFYIHCPC